MADLPLRGLYVVEIGTSIAAPFGAHVLAELGADVLKIERPGAGDDARAWGPPFFEGASPMFRAINRNKQSAVVDFKDQAQCAKLRRLIVERGDVVLQNLRPGVVEGCGLDAKSLRRDKPQLIYCNLSAYGANGRLRARRGSDPLMQACGGIMSVTGDAGRDPIRVGPSIVDQGAGMWAAIGILAALRRRDQTGAGCEVDGSLYETAVNWVGLHVATYNTTGKVPKPMGTENFGIAPYKAYRAQDGWLIIAAGNAALFDRLSPALVQPDSPRDPSLQQSRQVENRERLNDLLAEIIATGRRDAWIDKSTSRGAGRAAPQPRRGGGASQTQALGMVQPAPGSHPDLVGLRCGSTACGRRCFAAARAWRRHRIARPRKVAP